eukprot:TRINITY_DN5220_c0_g1_i2.p1 TRINITY_DN5220_c0_g1~~TRINITY_DN5220_c0_g1_i2.p1  ORF type:complete len:949 (+),score=182.23 TRINITY_DN5220_c0_g1_i2:31-2877(+)
MLKSKAFVKKKRSGNVVKVVREHYLRDDIACGSKSCNSCVHFNVQGSTPTQLSVDVDQYLLLDTNVILHQIDFLENSDIKNVVILQTVLEEVKNRSLHIYKRIREIIADKLRLFFVFANEHHRETFVDRLDQESPNDRNDRAIRISTKWYNNHLPHKKTILVTNDKASMDKAVQENIPVTTIQNYVESLNIPALLDLLAVSPENDQTIEQKGKRTPVYDDHKTGLEIKEGLQNGTLTQGVFHANRDNFLEGCVITDGKLEEVLLQGKRNMNRAIEGDVVAIQLLPEEEWVAPLNTVLIDDDGEQKNEVAKPNTSAFSRRITAKVVGIIKRNWKLYTGVLDTNSSGPRVLFISTDRKIPRIRITTRRAKELVGKRIVVSIDSWDKFSGYPDGHLVKELGAVGDRETESLSLLVDYDIPNYSFSETVLACLPTLPWTITQTDLSHRQDFRSTCIVSIDPPGCTDIDDALHAKVLPNGNFEVGVHIADVSHFVKDDTALDLEAALRGNTVYLIDRRIDMLPKLLGTDLCSLMSNVDRFAFSVIWELSPEAEIITVRFTKSIIKSRASLTYAEAQMRIDDKNMNDEITAGLRHLLAISKTLRKKRFENGALMLASPEVKFVRDENTQDPIDLEMYEQRETNALVEEFMLLANISVASKIFEKFPQMALLRRHPIPTVARFDNLKLSLAKIGYPLLLDSSKHLSDSLDKIDNPSDPYFNKLIRILTTRCMTQAVYFSSGTLPYNEFSHYGLASPIYTHFTSPIRRYADLIVHRLLAAAISINPLPSFYDKNKIVSICQGINHRHRMAQAASRASVELFTYIFFKNKNEATDAYITRIRENALTVISPKFGLEGNLFFPDGLKLQMEDDGQEISSTDKLFVIKMFQKVRVSISVDNSKPHRPKLKIDLISPTFPLVSTDHGLSNGTSGVNTTTPAQKKKRRGDLSSSSRPAKRH